MLKKIRVVISITLFALLTFYLLDFAKLLPDTFHRLAHLQFIPALLGAGFGILIFLILLTLLLGRIYCSSICPMGVFQDIISWIAKRINRKKKYKYSKAKIILRWTVLTVSIAALLFGFPLLISLVDPYSAYGRMSVHLFKPVYMAGNNVLESIFTSAGNYTFYKVDIFILNLFSFITAVLTFLAIAYLSWKYGRTYCNTICPVGTILGYVSKFSWFKIRINQEKCTRCGKCATKCKASCIDAKEKKVDYTRCVDCFNCLGTCKFGALHYTCKPAPIAGKIKQEEHIDESKRKFFLAGITAAVTAPSVFAKEKHKILSGGKIYTRQTPISPPGSLSSDHLLKHCTSCHLCISKCPSNVLKPAFTEYGIGGMMQPMMFFEKGFCNYDCVVCSTVCPNGALKALNKESKHQVQMGYVVFNEDICIVHTEETNCGACSEHCPTQAVKMIPYKDGLTIPSVNTDICVGCGGCEFICPVRPYRAIYVEGNSVHKEAQPIVVEDTGEIVIDDFGF